VLYLVAFFCPPLAVLLCGKPFQAVICAILTSLYFPGLIHAYIVVSNRKADLRAAR
jgi:uncharacterized membrane protein YqaE (UPF0057 family)